MMEDFLREQIEHGEHDILSNLAILKLCVGNSSVAGSGKRC